MRVVGIIANIMPRDNPGPGLRWMRQHSAPNSNVVHSGSGIAGVKSPIAVLTTEQLREPEGKHDADQFERDFFRGARRWDDLPASVVQPEPRGLERTIVGTLRKRRRIAKPPTVVDEGFSETRPTVQCRGSRFGPVV